MFQILKNTTKIAFAPLLLMSKIYAMEDVPFNEHANRYNSFLGQQSAAPKCFNTPVDAFKNVAKTVTGLTGGSVYHDHVKEGKAFGRSFTYRNQSALDYVFKLLTGQVKNWNKEDITSNASNIRIADVGCGLGVSAIYLFSKLADFYQSDKQWQFARPLEFDLYDVNEEHQPALSNLVNLVNMAYPKYFKVNTFVHDITKPFQHKNHYKIVLNLNVMHYVPSTKWSFALNNMREAMDFNGMMFLTADHYGAAANGNITKGQKILSLAQNMDFYLYCAILYSPTFGANTGTKVLNFEDRGLLENNSCVPGETYGKESITSEALSPFLKAHMDINGKNTICLTDSKGNRVETNLSNIIKRYNSGELVVEIGSYAFDNESLERAAFSVLDASHPGFKKLSLGWVKGADYNYAFSGITLMKVMDPFLAGHPSAQKGIAG